jgi:voltage-gated sodium channel
MAKMKELPHSTSRTVSLVAHHGRDFVLSARFECFMSVVIIMNTLMMAAQLQMKGYSAAYRAGFRTNDGDWTKVASIFSIAESSFNILYLLELLLRLYVFRRLFFRYFFNVFDGMIIIAVCFESFVFSEVSQSTLGINVGVLRVMRAFRMVRLLRFARFTKHMREINVLVRALLRSLQGVVWSVVLIAAIILVAAILMGQLVVELLDDDAIGIEQRRWLFEHFGTTSRGFYTMFECTFTSSWVNYSRVMIRDIRVGFACFWVPFVVLVNVTVMRVIAALFLRQTLAVAEKDSEKVAMQTLNAKLNFASEIRAIFLEADTDKN